MSKSLSELGALEWKIPRSIFQPHRNAIAELAWHRAYEVPEKTRAGRSPGDIAENFTLGLLGEVICKHALEELGHEVSDLDFAIQTGNFKHSRDLRVGERELELKTARVVAGEVSHVIPVIALERFHKLAGDTTMMFTSIKNGLYWNGNFYDLDNFVTGFTVWAPKDEVIKALAEPYAPSMKRAGFKAIYYNDADKHNDILRVFAAKGISLPPCP